MNSKKKGNKWENTLANWFYGHGFKAWKDGKSGGGDREKGDIGNNLDMTIESKAAKIILLTKWWRQTCEAASKHHNQPVLFIHQDGMAKKPPEWLVVMSSADWIELVKEAYTGSEKPKTDVHGVLDAQRGRDLKYAGEKLIRALKDYQKLLDV